MNTFYMCNYEGIQLRVATESAEQAARLDALLATASGVCVLLERIDMLRGKLIEIMQSESSAPDPDNVKALADEIAALSSYAHQGAASFLGLLRTPPPPAAPQVAPVDLHDFPSTIQ